MHSNEGKEKDKPTYTYTSDGGLKLANQNSRKLGFFVWKYDKSHSPFYLGGSLFSVAMVHHRARE